MYGCFEKVYWKTLGNYISKFKAKVYPAPQKISAFAKRGKKSSNTQEFKSDKTIFINVA